MPYTKLMNAQCIACSLLLLGPIASVHAETVRSVSEIQGSPLISNYLAGDYRKSFFSAGVQYDKTLDRLCETGPYTATPVGMLIIQPLQMEAGDAHPRAGRWTERFQFTRCGKTVVYSIGFMAAPNSPPRFFAMPPGDTIANDVLFADIAPHLASAVTRAQGVASDCKKIAILDTKTSPAVQSDNPIPGSRVIRELWTMTACGVEVPLDVTFMQRPNVPGMSFAIGLAAR